MKELRVLACSDMHGSKQAMETVASALADDNYDLLVMCGDFTTFGSTDYAKEFLTRVSIRILAVPGNCDIPDTVPVLEQANASVHNTRVEFRGWRFFGFGGALPSGSSMPFEVEEDLLERSLRSVAVEKGVMVTHVPAYGMNDTTRFGKHGGSHGVLRVANEFKPVLALSGHIHESQGRVLTKDTVFVNPGPARNGCYASIRLGESVEVDLRGPKDTKGKSTTY